MHVYSPLAISLALPGAGAGGIFISDVTGDGSGDGSGVYPIGDLLPGTKIGAFGRDVSGSGLAALITNYNNTQAGQPTPAGKVLINSGLFSLAELQKLGGVQQALQLPTQQPGLGWLRTVDLRLSYPRKIGEYFTIEPSVALFNSFNFANFDLPGNTLNGNLGGTGASLNSATVKNGSTRVLPGSGVFNLGSPRVVEWGMKLTF